jgi:hypothetical protein
LWNPKVTLALLFHSRRLLFPVVLSMRPLSRRWTFEEDDRLKAFVVEGASVVRAAAALKRKQVVIRARAAAKFGYTFPTIREAWKKLAGSVNSTWRPN